MPTIRVDSKRLSSLPGKAREQVNKVLREAGFDVLSKGQQNIRGHNLIDTGQLLNSGYVREEAGKVRVGFSAKHGIYHELGTRRNPPRPFLMPAFDEVSRDLERRLGEIDL